MTTDRGGPKMPIRKYPFYAPVIAVLGDSQTKYLRFHFDPRSRTAPTMFVSKSGGRIADFKEEVDQLPASVRVVVLHCGTNDMPDTDPDMAIRRYVQLIDHIRSRGNIELVCNPRAFAFNQRLMTLCRGARDLYFLDHGFHRQPPTRVLAADGLHPSFEGVTQIAHRLRSLVPRLLRRLPTRTASTGTPDPVWPTLQEAAAWTQRTTRAEKSSRAKQQD
ncbi:uncharacterized protein LOC135395538 [Ornithodoros turicata]|uniref:uncharacterized protein LOC135373890 n=2 Tax=Ornithodoros turicata TaxID=34597 RepID=UPI00313A187E